MFVAADSDERKSAIEPDRDSGEEEEDQEAEEEAVEEEDEEEDGDQEPATKIAKVSKEAVLESHRLAKEQHSSKAPASKSSRGRTPKPAPTPRKPRTPPTKAKDSDVDLDASKEESTPPPSTRKRRRGGRKSSTAPTPKENEPAEVDPQEASLTLQTRSTAGLAPQIKGYITSW